MAEINDLNVVDASNIARWATGMPPSSVLTAGRAMEGILARWHKDTNGSLVSTGSGGDYLLTTNRTIAAYYDGLVVKWRVNHASAATNTLRLNALSAVALKWPDGENVVTGEIPAATVLECVYDTSRWVITSAQVSPAMGVPVGSIKFWPALAVPIRYVTGEGQALLRTLPLFSVYGTTFGIGDGVTTFNNIDCRGVVPRGWDNGRGLDPGRVFATYQSDDFVAHAHDVALVSSTESQLHTHTVSGGDHQHAYLFDDVIPTPGDIASPGGLDVAISTGVTLAGGAHTHVMGTESALHTHNIAGNTGNSGGNETRMKNISGYWIVRAY